MNRCVFALNGVQDKGGVFYVGNSDIHSTQCTFVGNASNNGDVVFINTESTIDFNSCIFVDHMTSEMFEGGTYSINYSCLYHNQQTVIPAGTENFGDNPLFLNLQHGAYELTEDSPCIDTGDPDLPLDPDNTRADIGAFFFDQTPIGFEPPYFTG